MAVPSHDSPLYIYIYILVHNSKELGHQMFIYLFIFLKGQKHIIFPTFFQLEYYQFEDRVHIYSRLKPIILIFNTLIRLKAL